MTKIEDLINKANQCVRTAETYTRIGYPGHAAAAQLQAKVLLQAVQKVMNGHPLCDYEQRTYEGWDCYERNFDVSTDV